MKSTTIFLAALFLSFITLKAQVNENLGLNAATKATASSNYTDYGGDISEIIDGDFNTTSYWLSESTGTTEWVNLQLPGICRVEKLVLHTDVPNIQSFTVSYVKVGGGTEYIRETDNSIKVFTVTSEEMDILLDFDGSGDPDIASILIEIVKDGTQCDITDIEIMGYINPDYFFKTGLIETTSDITCGNNVYAKDYLDSDDNTFHLDPTGSSNLNDVSASIIRCPEVRYLDGSTVLGLFSANSGTGLRINGGAQMGGALALGSTSAVSGVMLNVNAGSATTDKLIQCSNSDGTKFVVYGDGSVKARSMKVDLETWADFVFEDDYQLMSLQEVEAYIKANKHLPNVPSETEALENGVDLATINTQLLRKIEELMLYTIEQQKQIEALQIEVQNLNK